MARDPRPQGDIVTALSHPRPTARPYARPTTRLGRRFETPVEADFFLLLRAVDAASADRPRLGETAHPAQDALRIGQEAGFAFAPRPLASVTVPAPAETEGDADADADDGLPGDPLRLRTFFFGLFGPNGPLPMHFTELAHARALNSRDHGFADFADALQHRMGTLFYRAWAEGQPALGLDRPEEDGFGRRLAALSGYGMPSLEGRDAMPDLLRRHFTGRLADGPRSPEGLAAILSGYFEVPVTIEEFVPSRAVLPPDARCRLGGGRATAALGQSATAGHHVRVHHHRFRVVIGPLGLAAYKRFLPGGPALTAARDILRNYTGDALEWELTPLLAATEVPRPSLGSEGRLGWTSWLGRRRNPYPARDLTLRPAPPAPQPTGA